MASDGKEKKCCKKGPKKPFPNNIQIKTCTKREPPHPCDPPKPCDPYNTTDGECPKPFICQENLKNPMKPHETKCKPGAFIGANMCTVPEPPHPCDPPLPCVPGIPKKLPCPEVALCRERIKNPVPVFIRCPSPDDLISKFLCEPVIECEKKTESKELCTSKGK